MIWLSVCKLSMYDVRFRRKMLKNKVSRITPGKANPEGYDVVIRCGSPIADLSGDARTRLGTCRGDRDHGNCGIPCIIQAATAGDSAAAGSRPPSIPSPVRCNT